MGSGNPEIQNSLKTHCDIAGLGSIVDKRRGGDVVPGKGWALLGDAARTLKSTNKTTKQQVSQKSTKELQNGAQESPTNYFTKNTSNQCLETTLKQDTEQIRKITPSDPRF